MAKFATALVLVSLVAVAMAGANKPNRSGGYKAQKAYHQPVAPYVKAKTYESSSYVPQKKAYNVPRYDMAGYPSESAIYKEQYKAHEPSYPKKASNYGAHHGSTYQHKVKDYPPYYD